MTNRDIYVAAKTFRTELDGKAVVIVAGKTFVRHGHELLDGREHLFKKVVPHYEVEAPKPAPRKQPSKKTQPKQVTPERVELETWEDESPASHED